MYWTIRWTDALAAEDRWTVLEAETRAEADAWGLKRGVPVVMLAESTPAEIASARKTGVLRRYTPQARYQCCGRPVGHWQLAAIMLCGVATAVLHLRPFVAPVRAFFFA